MKNSATNEKGLIFLIHTKIYKSRSNRQKQRQRSQMQLKCTRK